MTDPVSKLVGKDGGDPNAKDIEVQGSTAQAVEAQDSAEQQPSKAATDQRKTAELKNEWKPLIEEFRQPHLRSSIFQLLNTVVPYVALWGAMIWAYQISYWLILPFALVAAGFLVRSFILFHDCTHGSFFRSKRANTIVGVITGFLTFTPFHQWRRLHAIHHGTSGDLDRRGTGDVWTLTVEEYLRASRIKRLGYRLARNPIVLFVLAPVFMFLVDNRIPSPRVSARDRRWVHGTNVSLLVFFAIMILSIGAGAFFAIQLTVLAIAATAGIWLFYVQHQFEGVYWERNEEWDYTQAALEGSSFYKLPKVLQWFSGNIGFHHLHHLSPAIPNYNLERCHRAHPLFQRVTEVTLLSSVKSLWFRLWDEESRQLIGYRQLRRIRRARRKVA